MFPLAPPPINPPTSIDFEQSEMFQKIVKKFHSLYPPLSPQQTREFAHDIRRKCKFSIIRGWGSYHDYVVATHIMRVLREHGNYNELEPARRDLIFCFMLAKNYVESKLNSFEEDVKCLIQRNKQAIYCLATRLVMESETIRQITNNVVSSDEWLHYRY